MKTRFPLTPEFEVAAARFRAAVAGGDAGECDRARREIDILAAPWIKKTRKGRGRKHA